MILWTPVPLEVVMGDEREKNTLENINTYEMEYKGKRIIVEPSGFNQAKIVQLISTDPFDYLNAEFEPGTLISLR